MCSRGEGTGSHATAEMRCPGVLQPGGHGAQGRQCVALARREGERACGVPWTEPQKSRSLFCVWSWCCLQSKGRVLSLEVQEERGGVSVGREERDGLGGSFQPRQPRSWRRTGKGVACRERWAMWKRGCVCTCVFLGAQTCGEVGGRAGGTVQNCLSSAPGKTLFPASLLGRQPRREWQAAGDDPVLIQNVMRVLCNWRRCWASQVIRSNSWGKQGPCRLGHSWVQDPQPTRGLGRSRDHSIDRRTRNCE